MTITYSDLDNEVDPLDQILFRMYFPSIPGGGNTASLEINCQNAIWAGSSTEDYEVTRHGITKTYRGRRVYPRTLSINFVELTGAPITKALKNWLDYKAGSETNASQGFSQDYTTTAYLEIHDTTRQATHTITYLRLMVQDVPDITMDGTSSGQVVLSATFKYDKVLESGISDN
jgi:hypothetical protein